MSFVFVTVVMNFELARRERVTKESLDTADHAILADVHFFLSIPISVWLP